MDGAQFVDRALLSEADSFRESPRQRVDIRKAAEIAGVTERTIYNWIRWGCVETVETPHAGTRIYTDTLPRRYARGKKTIDGDGEESACASGKE